jgi:BirA family transcriptional regulator, biotin operon repressor / biotin---[acetyl-CoA-carboxylase] ligase
MTGLDERSLSGISTSLIGRDVEFFSEVTSTNILAKERAEDGCKEGLVIISSKQTGGKGRSNRTFVSPDGGLYLSVVLRPDQELSNMSILPLLAGLAVSKAISTTVLRESSLKWPNDVLMGGKKVCGILVESGVKGDKLEYVVIGIGINVNITMDQFPAELQEKASTLKEIIGDDVDLVELLRDLIYFLEILYGRFIEGEIDHILEKWSERSSTLGKQVRIQTSGGSMEGKALGVDQTGALMLKIDGSLHRIDVGDVEHL